MDFRSYVESEDVVKVVGLKVKKDEKDDTLGDSKSMDTTPKKVKKEPKDDSEDDSEKSLDEMSIDELTELLDTKSAEAEEIEDKDSDAYEEALQYVSDIKTAIDAKKIPKSDAPEEDAEEK
jgi:hypothetical protein